ncbi:hypothetical protein M9H77_00251 [Catharanthus roseus]|nr:hypothetical protein M9H77_00251 [Catharanthus roseus]
MALKNGTISILILFFFIISMLITAEAAKNEAPTASSSSGGGCDKSYIEEHMKITANKTREFLKTAIRKRLNNKNTEDAERNCLMSCYQAFQRAAESIERSIKDFSQNKYAQTAKDVNAYDQIISPCSKCSALNLSKDSEFLKLQKWAKENGDDILNKLKACK